MKRTFLTAAVAAAPLLAAAAPSLAQVTISTSTSTPVKTSTANNGQPSDVTIAAGGSINITAAGAALTLDSNNSVSNAGTLGSSNVDNTIGLLILGGNTGTATNTGAITLSDNFTAPNDPNNNGLLTGPFAQGTGRTGVLVKGPGTFTGTILNIGVITVQGDDSQGISIQAPISGDLLSQQVTQATSSTAAGVVNGSIGVTGANTVGLQITPTGSVGGTLLVTSITATGPAAQAAQINGDVGGLVNFASTVTATGFRTTTRQTQPVIAFLYTQQEMQLGGAAVTIGGNVGHGVIVSGPPIVPSTTNLDQDNNGVPDSLQGTGQVVSFGAAPAMQIGAVAAGGGAAPSITLGAYSASGSAAAANGFGLVIQGAVSGQGLFDQLTTPNLLAPIPATAIQIGGDILITPTTYTFDSGGKVTGTTAQVTAPSGAVNIVGGLYNSGSVTAQAFQADATGIRIGAAATVPTIFNDGAILAVASQVNNSSTVVTTGTLTTPIPVPLNVTAIQIDPGASVPSIVNNSGILANLSGTGGMGGTATAILDRSGTLQTLANSGSIDAVLTQTLALTSTPMPGATVAIDMSHSALSETISQTLSANSLASTPYVTTNAYTVGTIVSFNGNLYVAVVAVGAGLDPVTSPTSWRQIGSLSPSISGDILFGSGADTLDVRGGVVTSGTIAMGDAVNTLVVNGPTVVNGVTVVNSASITGYITEQTNGRFAISIDNGTLSDLNPNRVNASSVNLGPGGVLIVAADPVHNTNTDFVLSGASTIAAGAQFGLTLSSLQVAPVRSYTILETTGSGTLDVQGPLGPASIGNTPFLFTANAQFNPSPGAGQPADIILTVSRKSAADLGFNAAEASAFEGVLEAVPASASVQQALLAQTTEASFKSVYDQLLPNQGQGIFEALDAAAQRVSAFTDTPPDNATHVGGSSLWLQEVNERVDRSGLDSLASTAKILGVVAGYERMGVAGGALGLSLAYFNAQESDSVAALGARDVASIAEAGVYYRRSIGNFTMGARAAGGFGWFSETRLFVASPAFEKATADWSGAYVDAHFGAAYEVKLFGPYYARPQVSLDYLRLHQNGYLESGGDNAFNLTVAPQNDTQFTGEAVMVLGRQWGKAAWLRSEVRFGYREVFAGTVGDTTANFTDGAPFTLLGDPDRGGWVTFGFSLKSGSQFSYFALEGDADLRSGEQRYDLRVAGRSVF